MMSISRLLCLPLLLLLVAGGSEAVFFAEFFKAGFIRGVIQALKPNETTTTSTTTTTTTPSPFQDPTDYQDYAIADALYDYGAEDSNAEEPAKQEATKNLTQVEIPDLSYLTPNVVASDAGENYLVNFGPNDDIRGGRSLIDVSRAGSQTSPLRRVNRSAIFHERGSSVSGYETTIGDAKRTPTRDIETASDGRVYASADYDPIPSFDKLNEITNGDKRRQVDGPIYVSKYANSKLTPAPQAIPFVSDFYAPNPKFGLVEPVVVVTSPPTPESTKSKRTVRVSTAAPPAFSTRPISDGLRPARVRPARLTHVLRNYQPSKVYRPSKTHQPSKAYDRLQAYYLLRLAKLTDDDDD